MNTVQIGNPNCSISQNNTTENTPMKTNRECKCLLCRMKMVVFQDKHIPWITLARIVYLSLMSIYPEKKFFSVKTDVPEFIQSHMSILSKLNQFSNPNKWRKSMLDAINHSRFFQSGKDEYRICGYWKLKDTSIPFVENLGCEESDSVNNNNNNFSGNCCQNCNNCNNNNNMNMNNNCNNNNNSQNNNQNNSQFIQSNESINSYEESYVQQSSELNDSNMFNQQMKIQMQYQNQMSQHMKNVQSLQQYYSLNIQMIKNNNQMLMQLYHQNQNNQFIQQQIVNEYRNNESLIQKYSEELYKISDCCDNYYSSACVFISPLF